MLRKALEDNAAHQQQQQQQQQNQRQQQQVLGLNTTTAQQHQLYHTNDDDNDNDGNQVAQQRQDIAYTIETTPLLIATPTSSVNNDSYDDDNYNTTLESSAAVAASTASLSLQLKQQKQQRQPRQQSKEYGALLASATRLASVISNSDETTKRIVTTKITADASATGKRHTSTNTNDIEQATQLPTTIEDDDANDGYPTTDDDDDDDDSDGDNEDDDDDDDIIVERSWLRKTWDTIVTCFLIVANVENLWDSPPPPPSHIMDSRQQQRQRRRSGSGGGGSIDYEDDGLSTSGHGRNTHHSNSSTPRSNMMYDNNFFLDANNRRRNNTIVLFWFVVLASSYAMERSTFKLLVDRVEPFRLMFAQFVTGSHATILGMGMLLQRLRLKHQQQRGPNRHNGISTYSTATTTPTTTATSTASVSSIFQDDSNNIMMIKSTMPLGIPLVDVGLMALLDSITLLIVFLSGSHVPPTLTVILVQFTIPLIAFLTQFIHPDGRFRCCVTSIVSMCGTATTTRFRHNNSLLDDPNDNNNNNSNNNGSNNATIQPPPSPPPPPPSRNGHGTSSYYNQSQQQQQHTIPEGTAAIPATLNDGSVLRGWGGLSATHVWGSLILSFAVLLALVPAFYSLAYPDFFIYADTIPIRTAINTLLYVSSCFPAAASQLYKEHVFLQYKQPVNMNYLNLLLSLIQVMVAIIVTPLIYTLQGLGARRIDSEHDWTTYYPSTEFRQNYIDSIKCLFNILSDEEQEEKYAADALCKYSLLLILSYSISIISVGIAVDKIVNAGATKVMYRGISAGIIVAVVCMRYYDLHLPDFNYGPIISTLNLVCLLLLVLGSEVYHRVTLQESTFETVYPEITLQSYYNE